MNTAPNNAAKPRGRPFQPGNKAGKGRPAGSRNKATLLLEVLLEGEAEDVLQTIIGQAKGGNMVAGKALLDRLIPPRKDRPISVTLPTIQSARDAGQAATEVLEAVSTGDLGATEAQALAATLASCIKVFEAAEFEQRLSTLEAQIDKLNSGQPDHAA